MTSTSWHTQRNELEKELDSGGIIVSMTDGSARTEEHGCTVTVFTKDERIVHYAATEDLLVGICECSNTEMR